MSLLLPEPPFLPAEHIEKDIEYHLTCSGLLPQKAAPIDVEMLLEGHLEANLDQFAELPPDVLGSTSFWPGRPPKVQINRDLTQAADRRSSYSWERGRWRMTLAHEGSHIIFHRKDAETAATTSLLQARLFDDADYPEMSIQLQPCLKRDLGEMTRRIDRREYQANAGGAALLMPRPIFIPTAIELIRSTNAHPGSEQSKRKHILNQLAHMFDVSLQAVSIRLESLKLVSLGDQDHLDIGC